MASWNSIEWENKEDFDFQDFSRLERYFKSDPNFTLVNGHLIESEKFGELGSVIGAGGLVKELVKETKVYHKYDSTFLLERLGQNLTRLEVFSPSRIISGDMLEKTLKNMKLY